MLFWVHAAVAYLVFRVWTRSRQQNSPAELLVVALVVGSLLPDMVDKPLAFLIPPLPTRAFAYSLFTAISVILLAKYFTRHSNPSQVKTAFTMGYLSHLGADLIDYIFLPHESPAFLLWPLLSDHDHVHSVSALLSLVELTPYVFLQSLITVAAIGLWVHDGKPGYIAIVRWRRQSQ